MMIGGFWQRPLDFGKRPFKHIDTVSEKFRKVPFHNHFDESAVYYHIFRKVGGGGVIGPFPKHKRFAMPEFSTQGKPNVDEHFNIV